MGGPTPRRACVSTVLALVACVGGESPNGAQTLGVRDSAGVEIVTVDPSLLDAAEPVEVAREVLLEIGSLDGPPENQLYRVRDIAWLGDDRILIANDETEIRVYDLQGALVRTMGGEGQGPGEFQHILGVEVTSEGLVAVSDFTKRGITLLDSLGAFVADVRTPGFFPFDGRLMEDRWWVGKLGNVTSDDPSRPERQVDSVLAVDLETGRMETWIRIPGPYVHWESRVGGRPTARARAFSPTPRVALVDPVIVTATGEHYEYREWGVGGALRRIVRADVPAGAVTEDMRERVRRQSEEQAANRPPQFDLVDVVHDSTAVVNGILRDDAGRTWIWRRGSEPYTWDVFGSDGLFLVRATWPADFYPRVIGRDRVLGSRRDSLGIEYVQLRALGELPGG